MSGEKGGGIYIGRQKKIFLKLKLKRKEDKKDAYC